VLVIDEPMIHFSDWTTGCVWARVLCEGWRVDTCVGACVMIVLMHTRAHCSIRDGKEFKWSKGALLSMRVGSANVTRVIAGMHKALEMVPDVDPNNKCEVDKAMLNALKDAKVRAHERDAV
jgi:hypothetical protein